MKIELEDLNGNIFTISSDKNTIIKLDYNNDGTVEIGKTLFKLKSIRG